MTGNLAVSDTNITRRICQTDLTTINLALGREHTTDALFLPVAEPGFLGLAQHALAEVVDEMADHDEHKGNGVEVIDVVAEDADADDDAPEVAGEQADVEEGGTGEAVEDGHERIEEHEDEGVADEVADDGTGPDGGAEAGAVEDAGLHAVDDHAPEAELADDFVERATADEPFFAHVAEAVGGGADESEEIAFELAGARDVAAVGALDVVRGQQDAEAADADENTQDLGPVVAHLEEEEANSDDDDDGPEVDQLRGQDGRVAVREHGEVISLYVAEREDDVLPAVFEEKLAIFFPAVLVDGPGRVDQVEQDVDEKRLKCGDAGAIDDEKS